MLIKYSLNLSSIHANNKSEIANSFFWRKFMCMGKVVVSCPECKSKIPLTRPDSGHPFWSLNKPSVEEGVADYVEQAVECNNSTCAYKFSVYWFDK